ncbi:MAG: helix-turn-helix domain-containing protein [Oscillospiraceae bacterium]|nr:helix-turn-helix domain-containing protein [Oscillospiraceae bacterium]
MKPGQRLRILRKIKKNTLKEQSEFFGVSMNTIYRWENDLAMPRKSALTKMARFFGVTVDWIINGEMYPKGAPAAVTPLATHGEGQWTEAKGGGAIVSKLIEAKDYNDFLFAYYGGNGGEVGEEIHAGADMREDTAWG